MKTLICLLVLTFALPTQAHGRGKNLGDRDSEERGDNNWSMDEQQRAHREARDERRNERLLERKAREHTRGLDRKDDLDPRIADELRRERERQSDQGDGGEDGQGERY